MKTLTSTTKVKQTKRNLRVWIEGKKLTEAGFNWHTVYSRKIEDGTITLTLGGESKLKVAGRNRNGKELPIIDISIAELEGFTADQELTVTYTSGRIVIK